MGRIQCERADFPPTGQGLRALPAVRNRLCPVTDKSARCNLGRYHPGASPGDLCHAFRLDMAAWELDHGLRTGDYDLAAIERQLSRTASRLREHAVGPDELGRTADTVLRGG